MANFPTSVSTNSNLYIAVNGLQTTLAMSILATDTTIQLTSTSGFPTTGYVTIDNSEVVNYTGISGPNLTGCSRGADGTTAAPHSVGVTIGLTIVAAHHNLLKDEIIAIETFLGANGANVQPAGNYITSLTGDVTATGPGSVAATVASVGGSSAANVHSAELAANAATAAATVSTIMKRDANANVKINTVVENFATTVTAAGTTALTAASAPIQQFTGTSTQTVTLPDATTLSVGYQITVLNRSTGAVTVNNFGGLLQQTVPATAQTTFTCTSVGSSNGTWDVSTSSAAGITAYREDYVVGTALNNYTGSLTVFNLVSPYSVGGHSLVVTIDGDVQTIGASVDYLETNSTTVTFNNSLVSGQKVSFIFQTATSSGGTVNSGTAGQVAYYPASGPTVSSLSSPTVAQLQYFLNLLSYRRPNLTFQSSTTVAVELGLDGTSGDAVVLFPDGQLRTETGSGRYTMTISQNAVFNNATLGNNQGGLRTGSVVNNTWYACYAVKVSTFSANWVLVADTVLPLQANYSTLNTNFGTQGWLYLGLIRYGDGGAGVANAILSFAQNGNFTMFQNTVGGGDPVGMELAVSGGATSLTYTYTAGTSGATIPNNIGNTVIVGSFFPGAASNIQGTLSNASGGTLFQASQCPTNGDWVAQAIMPSALGVRVTSSSSSPMSIFISGWYDNALGIGTNPLI